MEYIPKSIQELPEPSTRRSAKRTTFRKTGQILDTLNEDQKEIFRQMHFHLTDPETLYYLMGGYAGTGKTYLTIAFIEACLASQNHGTIAITATTNKAVKVLMDKSDFTTNRVSYRTIHSLLGMKEDYDDFGNVFFKLSEFSNPLPASLMFMIIDEASMINRELYDYIIKRADDAGVKTIFVGDFFQIPPVKERECRLCLRSEQMKIKLKQGMLTKVVRQAEGNPIIHLATYIREHENDERLSYNYKEWVTPQGSVIPYDRTNKAGVLKLIEHLVHNDHFMHNPDYSKVLAWRNDTVNKMNHLIRHMIYGDLANKHLLLPGEKLIANKPIVEHGVDGKTIMFSTNSEFEVDTVQDDHKTVEGTVYKCFNTVVLQRTFHPITLEEVIDKKRIYILHPGSQAAFKKLLDALATRAKTATENKKFLWKLHFDAKDNFADVKYNYCLTSHKSQGSTFTNTIVLERDIMANQTMPERNRIFYVAVTRPSTNLIIVR